MKELLKASIPIIVETVIGFGIFKLLDICFSFIYNHFEKTGLYVSTFTTLIVIGTIINYVVHKAESEEAKTK